MDIIDSIDRTTRNLPEKVAHISDVRTLTYSELGKRSDALAAHFAER